LKPFGEGAEVTYSLQRKVEVLDSRQKTAKNFVDPSYEAWIITERHFHVHSWSRQPGLQEHPIKIEPHIWVCSAAP
jgi:hypothetical protein